MMAIRKHWSVLQVCWRTCSERTEGFSLDFQRKKLQNSFRFPRNIGRLSRGVRSELGMSLWRSNEEAKGTQAAWSLYPQNLKFLWKSRRCPRPASVGTDRLCSNSPPACPLKASLPYLLKVEATALFRLLPKEWLSSSHGSLLCLQRKAGCWESLAKGDFCGKTEETLAQGSLLL